MSQDGVLGDVDVGAVRGGEGGFYFGRGLGERVSAAVGGGGGGCHCHCGCLCHGCFLLRKCAVCSRENVVYFWLT